MRHLTPFKLSATSRESRRSFKGHAQLTCLRDFFYDKIKRMKKYENLIKHGIEQPLETVAKHHKAPLVRYLMLERKHTDGEGVRIALHSIKLLPEIIPHYCELHWHDFDEINIILSEDESLVYKVQLEDEIYELKAPTTVYIPKGIKHKAEVVSGKGMMITINFTGEYKAYTEEK